MYEGETCNEDMTDQCNACHEPGTLSCIEYLGGFTCDCKSKWWGKLCTVSSDTKPSEQKGNYYKLPDAPYKSLSDPFSFIGAWYRFPRPFTCTKRKDYLNSEEKSGRIPENCCKTV